MIYSSAANEPPISEVARPVPPPPQYNNHQASPPQDPVMAILGAIADVRVLVSALTTNVDYLKHRVDGLWQKVEIMEGRKADRDELKALEARFQASLDHNFNIFSAQMSETETQITEFQKDTEKKFEKLETINVKVTLIEHDTQLISQAIPHLTRNIAKLNQFRYVLLGGFFALMLVFGGSHFLLKLFPHLAPLW